MWDNFKQQLYKAHLLFNQASIIWYRRNASLSRFGEDLPATQLYTPITLKGLIDANYRRTWPFVNNDPSGYLDKESLVVILNMQYLRESGYLNAEGYFDFNPGEDYFTYLGMKYTSSGDTPPAQAGIDPTLFYLVLRREERQTGNLTHQPVPLTADSMSPTADNNSTN